ncbi:MAG: adenosylhomocysteinase [bacterium]
MKYDIKDRSLASKGKLKIEWAERNMPVLRLLKERFKNKKPLKGVKIGACLHVTTETANLAITLKQCGAEVFLCASNPLSTQDEVAASLVVDYKIPTFAIKGEDNKTYYSHIESILDNNLQITMDDGADLVTILHTKKKNLLSSVYGGTEETTTGVIRLKSMEKNKVLQYPIIAVNNALTKHLFDNRYGTGQSSIDGILRATNILLAGCNFVVCGYGWCGKGVASRAHGMGAKVFVTEIDPVKALEACMDGYQVIPMAEAIELGDIFITVTGNTNVINKKHFQKIKDGAIISNSGHFNVEIDIKSLNSLSQTKRQIREYVEEYTFSNGKKIFLLGEGRLINLAAAEGHPAMVMDMSFANQTLSAIFIAQKKDTLEKKVYSVPEEIDKEIAILKLKTMGIKIDELTAEQKHYLASWNEGT